MPTHCRLEGPGLYGFCFWGQAPGFALLQGLSQQGIPLKGRWGTNRKGVGVRLESQECPLLGGHGLGWAKVYK